MQHQERKPGDINEKLECGYLKEGSKKQGMDPHRPDATTAWKAQVVTCAGLTVKWSRTHVTDHLCEDIPRPVPLQLHFARFQLKLLHASSTEGVRKDS